jgi:hypothetical protein
MLRITTGLLAVVLAGSAGAAGWRSMVIDASSEGSFNESVLALKEKLPPVRRHVFEQSLLDIWVQSTKAAEADGREYTPGDLLRQVDGLGYQEVVKFTDPTGDTARRYFDQAYARLNSSDTGKPDVGSRAPRSAPLFGSIVPPGREAGESRFRPLGGEPGVNPWQK